MTTLLKVDTAGIAQTSQEIEALNDRINQTLEKDRGTIWFLKNHWQSKAFNECFDLLNIKFVAKKILANPPNALITQYTEYLHQDVALGYREVENANIKAGIGNIYEDMFL